MRGYLRETVVGVSNSKRGKIIAMSLIPSVTVTGVEVVLKTQNFLFFFCKFFMPFFCDLAQRCGEDKMTRLNSRKKISHFEKL